jgi:hypothetical protein
MATARQHIASDHQKEQAHWTAFAKGLGDLGAHIRTMYKETGMTGESKAGDACDKLKALAQSHADYHGAATEECMKAADADVRKIMPTEVSAVAPTNPGVTSVPRKEQRPISAKVESEFSKLLGLNPEDMHVEERSLRR